MIPSSTNSTVDYPSNFVFQSEIDTPQYMPNYSTQQQQPFFQYQYSQNDNQDNLINATHAAAERSLPPLSHLLTEKAKVKNNIYNNPTIVSQENNQASGNDLEVPVNHASSSVVNPYYQNINNELQQTYNNNLSNGVGLSQVDTYILKEDVMNNKKQQRQQQHQQQHQHYYQTDGLASSQNNYGINDNKNRFTTTTAAAAAASSSSIHPNSSPSQLYISQKASQSPVVSNDVSLHMTNPYTSPSSSSYYKNVSSQTTNKMNQVKYGYSTPNTTTVEPSLPFSQSTTNNGTWSEHGIQNSGLEHQSKSYEEYQKIYSFVPLVGSTQKKRPRRKFHEVERVYQCNYLNCTKAYGTLNHLNAHITMQEHGPKRLPAEFKELRKHLRKIRSEQQKKDKMEEYLERLETYDRNMYN